MSLVVSENVQPKSGHQRDVAAMARKLTLKGCHETVEQPMDEYRIEALVLKM
jgi:hypothetical protein